MNCKNNIQAKVSQVRGNVLRVAVPLQVEVATLEDGRIVKRTDDFTPNPSHPVTVTLFIGTKTYRYTPEISGNVVTFEDLGVLPVGDYNIEIKCKDAQGKPMRFMARSAVVIVDATADAGIAAGVEFDAETQTLLGAVFYAVGSGGGGGCITEETDPVFAMSPAAGVTAGDIDTWNAKQTAINDLDKIRAGAALGATAMQPVTLFVEERSGSLYFTDDNGPISDHGEVKRILGDVHNSVIVVYEFRPYTCKRPFSVEGDESWIGTYIEDNVFYSLNLGLDDKEIYIDETVVCEMARSEQLDNISRRVVVDVSYTNSIENATYSVDGDTISLSTLYGYISDESTEVVLKVPYYEEENGNNYGPYTACLSLSSMWADKCRYYGFRGDVVGHYAHDGFVQMIFVYDSRSGFFVDDFGWFPNSSGEDLAPVAYSGSYDDLEDKPTIPAEYDDSALDHRVSVLEGFMEETPSIGDIPTKTSDLVNDSGFVSGNDLADVATSGSYDDLTDKPTIPAAQEQADWNETDTTDPAYIKNKPTIPAAQVNADWNASSGVAQILNKPSIPTVPTNVSSFTNDAGYLTVHQDISGKADVITKVTDTSSGTASLSLDSGKFYVFSNALTALTITALNAPSSGMGIYAGKFTSDSTTACTLSVPASVTEASNNPTIAKGKTYEFSIADNVLLIVEL